MGNWSNIGKVKSVLVVDDNAANSFVLSSMLEHMGFDVDEAASGREAINYTCQKEYDLILMDHLMPEMDGIETIKQILFISEGKKCPVIIGVSATIDREVKEIFHNVGVDVVLEKPVSMGKLEEELSRMGIISVSSQNGSEEVVEENIDDIFLDIAGLNYKKGIEIMAGNIENYIKVLSVSVKNISDNYRAIELIQDSNQVANSALHFHSLKGIFLNIGADMLAEHSKELELAAKEGHYEEVHSKLKKYLEEVNIFNTNLDNACKKYNEKHYNNYSGEEISPSEFAGKLIELRAHIEDFEYIEITELLEQMLLSVQGERRETLKRIAEAIQEFEYDKALEILDAFQESF